MEFIEQYRTIPAETKSLIVNDISKSMVTLVYHKNLNDNLVASSSSYPLQESPTFIDNAAIDNLIIINGNTVQLIDILNISKIVIDKKSSIIIPYNTILILPKNYIFYGAEMVLRGTIIGADFFELSNYSKISIYPNSTWLPSEFYGSDVNGNTRYKNIINVTNFVLDAFSGVNIMGGGGSGGGDMNSFPYLEFYIKNLSIR